MIDARERAIRAKWFFGGLGIGLLAVGLEAVQWAAPLRVERDIAAALIGVIVAGYVAFRLWIVYAYNATRPPGTRPSTTFMFWRLIGRIDREAPSDRS